MKQTIKTLVISMALILVCLLLTACGKVSDKKFEKAFTVDRYENVKVTIETYDGLDLEKTIYLIQNDIIYVVKYNYEGDTVVSNAYNYYKELGDGTSEAYEYDSESAVWGKLKENSNVTKEYILKQLTDFADDDINSYTYNKEFKEYIKKTDDGIIELVFDSNGKLSQAMNCYKEKVSGTRISFTSYGLVRDLEIPEVE